MQLRSPDAVIKWATISSAVAARNERLKHLARNDPDQPATIEPRRARNSRPVLLKRKERSAPSRSQRHPDHRDRYALASLTSVATQGNPPEDRPELSPSVEASNASWMAPTSSLPWRASDQTNEQSFRACLGEGERAEPFPGTVGRIRASRACLVVGAFHAGRPVGVMVHYLPHAAVAVDDVRHVHLHSPERWCRRENAGSSRRRRRRR